MSVFDRAVHIYGSGRRLIDATRDLAVTHDLIRWAREDLEDLLLDLKLAVLDADMDEVQLQLQEVLKLYAELRDLVEDLSRGA